MNNSGGEDLRIDENLKGETTFNTISPTQLLVSLVLAIFIAEVIVMGLLEAVVPELGVVTEALVDSTALVLLVFPVLFVRLFQPMNRTIDRMQDQQETLASFKRAIDQTARSVIITDPEARIEYVNPAFEEVTGYEREYAIGRTPRILKSGEHDEEYYRDFWETLLRGERWKDEMIDETATGEQIVLDQTITPITDEENEPRKFVAVARDVTEQKAYQERLEEQRNNLEVLNNVVRHDIRNDLNLVTAYAEMLEGHVDGAEGTEYLEAISESAENAITLTESARDLADVMLQPHVENEQIHLDSVLEEEIDDVKSANPEANVEVDGTIPSTPVRANSLLSSVFRNLLRNAIQHNDKETPEVRILAESEDDRMAVRVADNGPGIPNDQREDVFGRGEKGLESPGTGIGLYLVDTLVGSYDGDVRIEDNDPEGAVFVVELPIAQNQS